MKTLSQIICGTILGVAVGGGAFMAIDHFKQQQSEKNELIKQHKKMRQAHRDSLMKIRSAQDELERKQDEEERLHAAVATYIKSFYLDSVLIPHPEKANKIFGLGECTEKELNILRNRLQIGYDHDNWYRVKLVGLQGTLYRHIKATIQGRDIIMEEVH